ncbi:MAG: hypothetical protein ABSB35_24135 [Bryobacteraceae bacterium]|jgi:hypothetical protein
MNSHGNTSRVASVTVIEPQLPLASPFALNAVLVSNPVPDARVRGTDEEWMG